MFKSPAQFCVIWHITTDHPPEIRSVVPYLDVTKFVDDDIVKASWRRLDQIKIEGNPTGSVGIAAPSRFHWADGDGWQWDRFSL